jgi:hypothetical protein
MIKFNEKNLKKGILILLGLFVLLFIIFLTSIDGGDYDPEEDIETNGVEMASNDLDTAGYKKFTQQDGNFSIEYPEEFRVSEVIGDFAKFSSDDGRVKFSVYSPLWFGDENVYVIYIQTNERLLGAEVDEDKVELGEVGSARRIVIRQKYSDKQNRYERTMIDTQLHGDSSSTRSAFSFEYASQEDYQEYLEDFEHFQSSLEQFAD